MNKDKLETALSEGNLARARVILFGRIKSSEFSVALYEQCGVVLLRMGDHLEAGKYLFLSGVRCRDYDAAIARFLHRYSRRGWQPLVESFPRRVKRGTWDALPANVRAQLETMGVPRQKNGQYIWITLQAHPLGRVSAGQFLLLIFGILFLGLVVSVIIAFYYDLNEAR